MKRMMLMMVVLMGVGCAYQGQTLQGYFQDPRALIKDPHFVKYKEQRDSLESQYLQKEITYADYVEQMNVLDEQYSKEVQERDAKIASF